LPFAGHALQRAHATFLEADAGARNEILDHRRDQHFSCAGLSGHACSNMHGDAPDVVACQLDLTGVQTGADLEPEAADRTSDCTCTADRARGSVERRQQAVADELDLAPAESLEMPAYHVVMLIEQLVPAPVAERDGTPGRIDDVGEQDGGEHAIGIGHGAYAGEELLDF